MAFLTVTPVGGGSTITLDVSTDGAGERESTKIGAAGRSASGMWRSSIRTEKREWQFSLAMMLSADFETFRNMVKDGAYVTVAGDAVIPTAGFTAVVEIGSADYVESTPTAAGFLKRAALIVRTV